MSLRYTHFIVNSNHSILLALETSQHVGGVALRDRNGGIQIEMLSPVRRHDDDLLPAIDRLLSRTGVQQRDLAGNSGGAVGVSIGPGGFTGLRIAVSTAKMFAEALGARVIAVPSALVVVESMTQDQKSEARDQRSESGASLLVTLASKGETCWCTRLQRQAVHWAIVGQAGLVDAHAIDLNGIDLLLGDEHVPPGIVERCEQAGVKIISPRFDPRSCLLVAERMLAAGHTIDPLKLVPWYPRQPEAVTLWERRAHEVNPPAAN